MLRFRQQKSTQQGGEGKHKYSQCTVFTHTSELWNNTIAAANTPLAQVKAIRKNIGPNGFKKEFKLSNDGIFDFAKHIKKYNLVEGRDMKQRVSRRVEAIPTKKNTRFFDFDFK
jgi:hypothetical protein